MSKDLGRLLTAMVTPFKADGSVDYNAAEKLAHLLVNDGSDGVVIAGAIATIAGADIHENGGTTGNGIHVLSPSGTAVVQIGGAGTMTTVQKNGGAGILVEQAPVSTAGNASSVFIDSTRTRTSLTSTTSWTRQVENGAPGRGACGVSAKYSAYQASYASSFR